MKLRSKELGDKNIVGENIAALRKMQGMSGETVFLRSDTVRLLVGLDQIKRSYENPFFY